MKTRRSVVLGGLGLVALAAVIITITSGAFAANPGQRSVSLVYDGALNRVVGTYDTTATVDKFVTITGSGGPVLWGEAQMETDPSGEVAHRVALDPSGTQYTLTVTWFNANQVPTQTLVGSVTKP